MSQKGRGYSSLYQDSLVDCLDFIYGFIPLAKLLCLRIFPEIHGLKFVSVDIYKIYLLKFDFGIHTQINSINDEKYTTTRNGSNYFLQNTRDNLEVFSIAIGILIVIVGFPFAFAIHKRKKSNNKIIDLDNSFSAVFRKISNKKCSIKRLSKIDWIEKTLMFKKCNIFVKNEFIVVQGIDILTFFDYVVRDLIFTSQPDNFKDILRKWEVIKPLEVELNSNRTEIKIIFKPVKSISDSQYSLIISGLEAEEFESLQKVKNYC